MSVPQTPVAPTEQALIAGLRRMRTLATLLLAAMIGVFVAASIGQVQYPWLAYVRAFAEAGMVGACADWFAVVALFRRPLGLPIPHTAIVPRNKARIAGAMGRFITNNFLSPRVLAQRLATVDAARWVATWLTDVDNARRAGRAAARVIIEVVHALPRAHVDDVLGKAVQRGVTALPAAPLAANLLEIVWAQGQTQKLIERCLELAEGSLASHKDAIRRKVEAGSSRWIPRWIDGIFADRLIAGLQTTLAEMRDPEHPWRVEFRQTVESLIERLKSDPELQASVEAAKADLIADPLVRAQILALWREVGSHMPQDLSAYAGQVELVAEAALAAAGRWLRDDPGLATRLNRWMRYLLRRAIVPRRTEIGAFVTHVVESWDTATLIHRIELQVGKDLQYIRINGTLVGGLVGVVIHVLSTSFLSG